MKSKYLMIAALLSLFALAGCKRPETAPTETPPASQDTMSPQQEPTTPPAEMPPPEQTPPSDQTQPEQQPPQQ
jgi:predicted small lipoprotein YifL